MQNTNVILGLLQVAVPFYGLRLSRLFGTKQIGGLLVIAFLTLAMLRAGGTQFLAGAGENYLARTLVDALVPILLLIGMAHVEAISREQSRSRSGQGIIAAGSVAHDGVMAMDGTPNPAAAGCAAQHFNRHLAVISLYSKLLLNRHSDAKTADHQWRIMEETALAMRLSRKLLAAAQKQPLRPVALPISVVLGRMRPLLWRSLVPGMVLDIKCAEHLPEVNVDAAQLGCVLSELVKNAVEASPQRATISISAESIWVGRLHRRQHGTGREGRHVRLTVADRGQGMSPAVQARLFEPFFTTKDAQWHAGLGLASAKGLVKEHGGWIEVETQQDRGTSVHVYLPTLR